MSLVGITSIVDLVANRTMSYVCWRSIEADASRETFPAADLTVQTALERAENTAHLAATCQQQRPPGRTQHTRQGGQWQGWELFLRNANRGARRGPAAPAAATDGTFAVHY